MNPLIPFKRFVTFQYLKFVFGVFNMRFASEPQKTYLFNRKSIGLSMPFCLSKMSDFSLGLDKKVLSFQILGF